MDIMKSAVPKTMLGFVALFAVLMAGVVVAQTLWWDPARACERKGAWWDNQTRVCATPVQLSTITGRPSKDVKTPTQPPQIIQLPK
jgi:hypothetical protein